MPSKIWIRFLTLSWIILPFLAAPLLAVVWILTLVILAILTFKINKTAVFAGLWLLATGMATVSLHKLMVDWFSAAGLMSWLVPGIFVLIAFVAIIPPSDNDPKAYTKNDPE